MNSYPKRLFRICAVIVIIVALLGCSEDVFLTDLDDTPVKVQDTSSTAILFKSYQVPPMLGNHPVLYVGTRDDYTIPLSLLELASLGHLDDGLITVDSAFVQFTVDTANSDSSFGEDEFTLGFFFDFDSSYSDSGINYLNIDELIPGSYRFLDSSRVEVEDTLLPYVRFDVEADLIESWAESDAAEPLLILESLGNGSRLHAFYSRETSPFYPFLKVFYTADTASAGTSSVTRFRSDLPIVIPPSLEGDTFDSTRSYVGGGAGLRSLIFTRVDSLGIPGSAVIVEGNLILPVDVEKSRLTGTSGLAFRLFTLQDSVENRLWGEVLPDDIYESLSALGTVSPAAVISDSTVTIDMSDILQSLVVRKEVDDSPIRNFGLKLIVVPPVSPSRFFDFVAFHTDTVGDLTPRIEILYDIR